jgi:hypothetical protein
VFSSVSEDAFVAAADFDGDKIPDLVTSKGSNTGDVAILHGNGDGSFTVKATYPTNGAGLLVAGDFNQDGLPDVAALQPWTNTVVVLLNQGGGSFGPARTFDAGLAPQDIATADFDADGRLDLAIGGYFRQVKGNMVIMGQAVVVLLGVGGGAFAPAIATCTYAGIALSGIAVTDFDGDGKPDVAATIVTGAAGGEVVVQIGNGDGTLQQALILPVCSVAKGQAPYVAAVAGDLNGDGKTDFAVPCTAGASTAIDVLLQN